MTTVNTVLGPVDTANPGFTLMHEHVVHQGPLIQNYPELFGPGIMEWITTGINKAREGGINTIVDATQDIEYLTWILDQGCYLGMDRFPGSYLNPYARTETMKKLIDVG